MIKPQVRLLGVFLFLLVVLFGLALIRDNTLHNQEELNLPNRISSYRDNGNFKIDPKTILESLEDGEINVFAPLLVDPQEIFEEIAVVSWLQENFLKIASALGQFVWNDPMDLKDWSVYDILFKGSCDDPDGFDFASITYFKVQDGKYLTRHIEIDPEFGLVRWGSGEIYPRPIIQKWKSVDLVRSNITADDAFRIANENGEARSYFKHQCGILISSPQINDNKSWYISYIRAPDSFTYIIDMITGDYAVQKPNN